MTTYCVTVVLRHCDPPEVDWLADSSRDIFRPTDLRPYDVEHKAITVDYRTATLLDMEKPMVVLLDGVQWWNGWEL